MLFKVSPLEFLTNIAVTEAVEADIAPEPLSRAAKRRNQPSPGRRY